MLLLYVVVALLSCSIGHISGQSHKQLIEQRDPRAYTNFEILSPGYVLEWTVNWGQRRILFNVTVQTRGYVALGLSAKGRLDRSDFVIGGVDGNGNAYLTDRYGIDNSTLPQVDISQDWTLHGARENASHTFLSFSRDFDNCDPNDYPINENDAVTIIWAYGSTDNPSQEWPSRNQGTYPVYLLDPNIVPRQLKETTYRPGPASSQVLAQQNLKLWTITASMRLPANETTYQCTVHKAPRLERKNHMVAFHTRLETEEARGRTHHIILYRCMAPPGQSSNQVFGRFLNQPGQQCYFPERPMGEIPTQYCLEVYSGYAIGTRMFYYPDHTGHAFGESPDEYYVFQVHYDNPQRRSDIQYDIHFDMYYTDQLRPADAGMMYVGHVAPGSPSILIPQASTSHQIRGQCSPQCTQRMMPEEGVNVFGVILHTHTSGRKVRVRHFRGNQELPWLADDSNYINTYQTMRLLKQEVNVRRGDHLVVQCEYDNTWTNRTVDGGFATRQEMCLVFLLYDKKIDGYPMCRSEITDVNYMNRYLGITNVTWDPSQIEVVATSPSNRAGMTIPDISDTLVNWTPQLRAQLQNDHLFLPQKSECLLDPIVAVRRGLVNPQDLVSRPAEYLQSQDSGFVTFPAQAAEYIPPPRTCTPSRNRFPGLPRLVDGRGGGNLGNNLGFGGFGLGSLNNQLNGLNLGLSLGQNRGLGNNFGGLGGSIVGNPFVIKTNSLWVNQGLNLGLGTGNTLSWGKPSRLGWGR